MHQSAADIDVSQRLAQMRADAILSDDIQPECSKNTTTSTAFITGATGFLGRYAVKELVEQTKLSLICLVQGDDLLLAQKRLWAVLDSIDVDETEYQRRITVVCGSLKGEYFGLETATYEVLAQQVDRIYHCAAMVNWARSYRKLRRINVLGTLKIIQFACHGCRKSVLFVSSIAVGYATDRVTTVDEQTDMLPHIANMPLGYAQSKCVAESLLRQAAQRGLNVTILRPALISGDTRTGVSNTEDFVAALLQGCSRLGLAMDQDWLLDFVPVDCVAKVIVGLGSLMKSAGSEQANIVHLLDQYPRCWRELILFLNLAGYPIKFASTEQWLDQAFTNRHKTGSRLYAYRRFFQGLPSKTDRIRPFESYLQDKQQLIDSGNSNKILNQAGLSISALDAVLLQRYIAFFQDDGLLSRPAAKSNQFQNTTSCQQEKNIHALLIKIFQVPNQLSVNKPLTLKQLPLDAENGILNQLAAAQGGSAIGLRAYRVTTNTTKDVVVKIKGSDTHIKNATVQMAALCDTQLGMLFEQFRDKLGLCGAQQREATLYSLAAPALRQYSPRCFGIDHNSQNGLISIVLEKIEGADKIYRHNQVDGWSTSQIKTVIDGLVQIQSTDLALLKPLIERNLLLHDRSTTTMLAMTPLWRALASFAAGQSEPASQLLPLQLQLIDNLGFWWPTLLAQPQSLIHNDFNPRNLLLREPTEYQVSQLCVYDWELASIGAPQRDLAEFICFVVNPHSSDFTTVRSFVEAHRQSYVALTGKIISADSWQLGFTLALQQFVITRLPMYALMNRFKPQHFLQGLNNNAFWLMSLYKHVICSAATMEAAASRFRLTTIQRLI